MRCLVINCSRTKRTDPELLPAFERYTGPAFAVLRRYLYDAKQPAVDVYILSALHGLIPAYTPIAYYDRILDSQQAKQLRPQVMRVMASALAGQEYAEMLVSVSKRYRQALPSLPDLLPGGGRVIVSSESSGRQLSVLKAWLWQTPNRPARASRSVPQVARSGTAQRVTLRGESITFNTDSAYAHLHAALGTASTDAFRIRQWYVELGEHQISPKWAAQQLFGVPTSRFSADEARRVLHQLGIECQRL